MQQYIHYTLRIAVAMCFIGHGAFGVITKPIWCNYFAVFGIEQGLAYQLMPIVGDIDIILGVFMLIYPVRAIPAWLVIWGLFTALLRPLSGEPVAELVERAGNFGAPLALLLMAGIPKHFKQWFERMDPRQQVPADNIQQLSVCLKVIVFLLLAGHGWLNIIGKKGLVTQYAALGFPNPVQAAEIIGIAEVAAGIIILFRPVRYFVFIVFLWKMISELFYPKYEIFEWIERGGSYGTLLALWMVTARRSFFKMNRPHLQLNEQ
ncbi:hypothetical protein [Ferruginibacter sp.]